MYLKSILAATVLLIIPTLGFAAGGCNMGASDRQAMSCVVGTHWDTESGACVPVTTS